MTFVVPFSVQHGNVHASASTGVEKGYHCVGWEYGFEERFRRGLCNNGFEASAFTNFHSRSFSHGWAPLDFKPPDFKVVVLPE